MNFGGGMPYGQGQDMSGNLIEYDGTVYGMAGGAYSHGMEPSEYPMFGGVGDSGAGGGASTDGEYQQTNSLVVDGGDHFAVTATAFDHQEELLWMGNMGGHVTSYYSPGLQKYTSFQVHASQEIRQICPTDSVVLCLSQSQLRGQLRRGLPAFTHASPHLEDMQCMLSRGDTSVLMGGHQNTMVSYDMVRGKETQVVDIGGNGCAILRHHPRLICCGDTAGRVTLRDPSSLRAQHSLDAHSAGLNDLDVHNNLLVTCGFSHRGGKPAVDRHLMIYDLRILRAISTIPVMLDPYLLKFIPSLSSRLAVVSLLGQLQIVETAQMNQSTLSLHSVETGGNMCTAMDISANSQAMSFGDGGGCLHLLTLANQECTFNNYSRETEFADPFDSLPAIPFTDRLTPLATVPMPITSETLLSDWPAQWCAKVYRKPMKVDPVVLKTMRMVGTIGYAPNPGNRKRNQIPYKLGRPGQRSTAADPPAGQQEDPFAVHVPKRYRKIDVKYSRNGLDEVDHLQYNRTSFSGLESSLPNSYCNAMLQVLYCLEPMREALISHLCQREFCLSCELSFLFHMLDTSQGVPCQASNFLRAFRTIPEATALGLILSDTLTNRQKINLPRLIQNWNRFILQQLDTECSAPPAGEEGDNSGSSTADAAAAAAPAPAPAPADAVYAAVLTATAAAAGTTDAAAPPTTAAAQGSSPDPEPAAAAAAAGSGSAPVAVVREPLSTASDNESPVARILGALSRQTTRCIKCGASSEKESTILLCNLTYPQELDDREISFGDTLASSLCLQQTVQAWCDLCGRYQPTEQVRHLLSLPHCLAVNCCTDNPKDVEFWRRQSGLLWNGAVEQEAGGAPPAPPSIKPCRYGAACTRPDCHFWHGGRPAVPAAANPTLPTDDGKKATPHWLPHVISCQLQADGTVSIVDGADKEESSDWSVYDLTAVVCHVSDPKFPDKNNLVSVVRVGPGYHERAVGSAVAQWYIFNDLGVTPVSRDEAVWLPLQWKVPTVLYYQSRRPCPVPSVQLQRTPLTAATLMPVASVAARPAQTGQFTHLEPDEMPAKGDLVAMDAEFVTLNQEEAEIRSDGTKSMLKPSHMSVARISVVRGQGPREGLPFIDDYISTQEQVVDYLTKFSGIKPGDLDANFTSKHLATLKSTYLKLRFLVDNGVKFVGHGLKNDFRVINLTVPPDQVIDTVHLFYRPHQRMVSLRFLAWHFLKLRIQSETHDSVEDARTALALYRRYQQLQAQGGQALNDAIQQMYEAGRQAGWKVPGADTD